MGRTFTAFQRGEEGETGVEQNEEFRVIALRQRYGRPKRISGQPPSWAKWKRPQSPPASLSFGSTTSSNSSFRRRLCRARTPSPNAREPAFSGDDALQSGNDRLCSMPSNALTRPRPPVGRTGPLPRAGTPTPQRFSADPGPRFSRTLLSMTHH